MSVTVVPPGKAETLPATWTRWRAIRGVRPAWLLLCRRRASERSTRVAIEHISGFMFAGRSFVDRAAAEQYYRSMEGRYRALCANPKTPKHRSAEVGRRAGLRGRLHALFSWMLPR